MNKTAPASAGAEITQQKGEIHHMQHYICLNPISQAGLEGFTPDYVRTETLTNAQAVLVRSASMLDMELPEEVACVARAGAGVNNIPSARYAEQGIVVFNTPGANANGVKELVFAGMLLASRDIVGGVNWVNSVSASGSTANIAKDTEKEKKRFAGHELAGKKLGVIGLGAIGVRVANAAIHLGMDVYGYDPYISVDAAWALSRSIQHINEVDRIYSECDYITIHVPLTDSTKCMIGEQQISMMKENAVLLNFARDLLVDEQAVVNALAQGRISRYVSDFPNPVTAGRKGVILIPHLGASTSESEDNCARMAVSQIRDYLENGNIRNSVNYPACSMGICKSKVRIAICHKNIRQMISRFTGILADQNIANMSNASRGEFAYTLFDLEDDVTDAQLAQIRSLDGVFRVRRIA